MAGHKTWAVGEEVIASDLNPILSDQIVAQFSSAAARTAGWAAPPEGAMSYLADTNELNAWSGTAWEHVATVGPYLSWTGITAGQPGPVSVTVFDARYQRAGAFVRAQAGLRFTSGGASGAPLAVTLPPVAPRISGYSPVIGTFRYFRTGVTVYTGTALAISATAMNFQYNGVGGYLGNGDFIVAVNDELQVNLHYEKA